MRVCWTKITIIYNLTNVYQTKDSQLWSESLKSFEWGLRLFCRLSLWLCLSFFLSHFFFLSIYFLYLSAFFFYFCVKLLYERLSFLPLNCNKIVIKITGRRKIKPFLQKNDPEKILEQSRFSEAKSKHKIGLGKPKTIPISRILQTQ